MKKIIIPKFKQISKSKIKKSRERIDKIMQDKAIVKFK